VSAKLLNRIILGLSALGIFIAGFLALGSLTGQLPPCTSQGGCAAVQTHPVHSYWFGIPVSIYGLLGYLTVFAIAALRSGAAGAKFRKLANIGLAVAGVGAILSFYLIFIATFEIQQSCEWCFASAATMVALAIAHGFLATLTPPEESKGIEVKFVAPALGASLLLIFGLSGTLKAGNSGVLEVGDVSREDLLPAANRMVGSPDAEVFVVEFADVNCPACRQAHGQVKSLLDQFGGKVGYAFRHLPLTQIPGHETSAQAAILTVYAAEQGRYFDMLDAFFKPENETRVKSSVGLIRIGKELGFDADELSELLRNQESDELQAVVSDMEAAQSIQVRGTPTFVLMVKGQPAKLMRLNDLGEELTSGKTAALLK
jgi:protein-disulfide isomerase/uncharacterized membrane protein